MSPIRMVTAPPSTRDYVSVKLTDEGYLLYLSKFLAPCLHTAIKPMWRDMLKDSLGVKDSHVSQPSSFLAVVNIGESML